MIAMKARNLVSALFLALALHVSWCREEEGYYTNRFAVQVNGGSEMASFVAESHGMKNLGPVRRSSDYMCIVHIMIDSKNVIRVKYVFMCKGRTSFSV